jgi:predicted nucleic acid-binding protein
MFVLGVILPDVEIDFAPRDPDDAAVVSSAVVGRADAIVTGDRGLLDDAELRVWLGERGIELLTPAELLERLA